MAILGKKIEMKILDGTGSSATDLISGLCVHEIGDFSATAGEIDATCHGDSDIRKKIRGLIDLGSLPVTVDYKDVTTSSALWTAFTAGESLTIKIIETSETSSSTTSNQVLTFSGFISGMSETHPLEDVIRQTLTITLDGITPPAWSSETA